MGFAEILDCPMIEASFDHAKGQTNIVLTAQNEHLTPGTVFRLYDDGDFVLKGFPDYDLESEEMRPVLGHWADVLIRLSDALGKETRGANEYTVKRDDGERTLE